MSTTRGRFRTVVFTSYGMLELGLVSELDALAWNGGRLWIGLKYYLKRKIC